MTISVKGFLKRFGDSRDSEKALRINEEKLKGSPKIGLKEFILSNGRPNGDKIRRLKSSRFLKAGRQ